MIIILKKAGGLNNINKIKIVLTIFFVVTLFSKNANTTVVNDYEIENLINEIIKPVIISSKIKTTEPYVYIILSDVPNAYVDPFNRIFITTSFISIIDPEALAGVIAHEIGHIKLHHIEKRISNLKEKKSMMDIATILSLSASIFSNNSNIFMGSNIASSEIINKNLINYSIDQEREADIVGLRYLEESGITSESLKNFLIKLLKINESIGINEKKFNILTHPYKSDRINKIKDFQLISKHNESFFSEDIHNRFELVRQKIDGYTNSLNEIKLKYKNLENGKNSYAYSIGYAREGYIEESIKNINILISMDKNNPFFYETKGEILLNFGYSDEAYKFFKKSLYMNQKNDFLRIRIIEYLYNKMENKTDATVILKEFDKINININNNKKILQIISEVYKLLEKKDLMYIYLSKFEMNKNNKDLALEYLLRAEKYTNNKKTLKEINNLKKILTNE